MNAKELFAVAIRVLGLCGFVFVLRSLVGDIARGHHILNAFYIVQKLAYLAVGLYLVRGAPLLMKLAYPEEPEAPSNKS